MKSCMLLVILSALSQILTLPTIRDDLAELQRHPYHIQQLEHRASSSSYLAKRDGNIATIYWDVTGSIKAIFNMNINVEVMDIFHSSGVNIARNVGAECIRYLHQTAISLFLTGSVWGVQLGSHWRNILHRPWGVGTISIVIILDRRFTNPQHLNRVLEALKGWFTQGGNTVEVLQVVNALIAGNAPGSPIVEEPTTTGENEGDPRFCTSPVQNSPFAFVGGNADTLLKHIFRCPNSP